MIYSIITPVFNRADCIYRCIESVISQLKWNISIEHIIVDDGSTDDTINIIEKYIQKYNHIKFIKFPRNRGTNAARNAAINIAAGQFCILLDSDDYFVDNALKIINNTVTENKYQHYLFAPDDMVAKYLSNNCLNKNQAIVTFEDFLLGRIGGDFIHVVDTSIMKKYPFDESLRIYEGVFFLRFYREARSLLFTNQIVTIRERSRQDSVTRTVLRTNDTAIKRTIKSIELQIEWFHNDYIRNNAEDKLIQLYLTKLESDLLLSNYKCINETTDKLNKLGYAVPFKYKFIVTLHLGSLYWILIKCYLCLKYKILRAKIN